METALESKVLIFYDKMHSESFPLFQTYYYLYSVLTLIENSLHLI